MTATPSVVGKSYRTASRGAESLLHAGRAMERAGALPEAATQYERAVMLAEESEEGLVLAEALRRLGALSDQRDDLVRARDLCERSYHASLDAGSEALAAEALNVSGIVEMHSGHMEEARSTFRRALVLAGLDRDICSRVEGNLGIVANIEGDYDGALTHYHRAFEAARDAHQEHSCGIAYVNLGITSTQLGQYAEADAFFERGLLIAESTGDVHLKAACVVQHAKVHAARQRFDEALRNAEVALAIFDQLGARAEKAEAYRVIGIVFRETGRPALAESRFVSAIDLARDSGSALAEAEASRELAALYHSMGRNQEALAMLNAAHRLFGDLNARVDLVNVDGKVEELEGAYLELVQEWGQSIESSDSYTFGHCGRVADTALAVARRLRLEGQDLTAIRLGAYLHDVGKVKVPHEILNKPGALTRDEFELVKMHPVWGVELLDGVEFPWDIKAVIRWHHEKYDGTGYPDRLRGDQIPLSAQIVGIADVYDALSFDRPYRPGLSRDAAIAEITRTRTSWSEEVFGAFMASVSSGAST